MAGLSSVISNIALIKDGIGLVNNLVSGEVSGREQGKSQDLALRHLQERQAEQQRQSAEDAALERQQISLSAEQEERKRRDALRRAVARQRAQFGGSGISSNGGSSEAVLLGLFDETEAERGAREKLDALRFGALDQGLDQQRRLDVIQRTQLQESQRIGRLTADTARATRFTDFGVGALELVKKAREKDMLSV